MSYFHFYKCQLACHLVIPGIISEQCFDVLMQDCSNSIANALGLLQFCTLQFCTKPSI